MLIIATLCWESSSDSLALTASYQLLELLVVQIYRSSQPDQKAILGYSTVAMDHALSYHVFSTDSPSMLSLESDDSLHQHQVLLLPLRALLLQELHIPDLIFVHQRNLHQHGLLNFDLNERGQRRCLRDLAPQPSANLSMCPISNDLAAVK
jgi:hypothetical protein